MTDSTTEYAQKVVSGEILASKKVILAAKRHLNDLEKAKNSDFSYVFDVEKAEKAIGFMDILPDPKTMRPFGLADYQQFIIGSLYGWVRRDNPNLARYHKAFISMARKSGKSILVSGIALEKLLLAKEPAYSRQIYTTANDKNQASIVFKMVAKQLTALQSIDPEIRRSTKKVRDEIKNLDDYSYIRPLSRETGAIDGFEPAVAILDEYAASKTTEMMELLESGQGQLLNPLMVIISTAGFDLNLPMRTIEYPYADKVLRGELTDDQYFAYVAEQDSVEEIEDESTWVKSNPILTVPAQHDVMLGFLRKRRKEGLAKGQYNQVLVKNFNMWRQSTEDSYLDIEAWQKSELAEKPSIAGQKAWIGVDVGRTSDLFAISWLIPHDDGWWLDGYAFVASKGGIEAKIKTDKVDYLAAEQAGEGEITELESGVIDNDRVYQWLEAFIHDNGLDVQGIMFDPYQFGPLLTAIEKRHPEWPLVQIRQGTITLSMPTKQFRDDLIAGKIQHSDNRILRAAAVNAVLMSDNNGVRINKNKYANKIDMLDAALDAYSIAYRATDDVLTDDDVLNGGFGF
ncbi:terminase large subunit [Schleiferilactobacillus shenzhenensis]|uniref:Terminase large subunit n=1 Tax=Schleiferilactobacillus shenzhenensis LY-73 TaxID=1231336 RepID=U4TGX4_9LACO|nr:terminase TerL endonuclease subunit [Schleiferilactobacillus shenzhenensis]ERL64041.1 hypothetical protein L248_1688 [Schleiferilactobacillus shenzhenensis LY-73]